MCWFSLPLFDPVGTIVTRSTPVDPRKRSTGTPWAGVGPDSRRFLFWFDVSCSGRNQWSLLFRRSWRTSGTQEDSIVVCVEVSRIRSWNVLNRIDTERRGLRSTRKNGFYKTLRIPIDKEEGLVLSLLDSTYRYPQEAEQNYNTYEVESHRDILEGSLTSTRSRPVIT